MKIRVLLKTILIAAVGLAGVGMAPAAGQIPLPRPAKPAAKQTAQDMLAPTLVSFDCDKSPTLDAIQAFEKQTGTTILGTGAGNANFTGTVAVHAVNQPWAAVVAEFIQQGHLTLEPRPNDEETTTVWPVRGDRGQVSIAPPKIDSSMVYFITNMDTHRRGNGYFIDFRMRFVVESKVNVVGLLNKFEVDKALDENNVSIKPPINGVPRHEIRAVIGAQQITCHGNLVGNGPIPQRIKVISGLAGFVLGFDPQVTDLAPLIDGQEATVTLLNGTKARLHGFSENSREKGRYTLSMSLPRNLASTINDDQLYDYATSMHLSVTDDNGHRWKMAPWSRDRVVDKTDYDIDLQLATANARNGAAGEDAAPDAKLPAPNHITTSIVTRTEQKVLPFEFEDVPVPKIAGY